MNSYVPLDREAGEFLLPMLTGDELKVYMLLLIRARFEDCKVVLSKAIVPASRGDVFMKTQAIASACGMDEGQVEAQLKALEGKGLIRSSAFQVSGKLDTMRTQVLNYDEIDKTRKTKAKRGSQPEWYQENNSDPY